MNHCLQRNPYTGLTDPGSRLPAVSYQLTQALTGVIAYIPPRHALLLHDYGPVASDRLAIFCLAQSYVECNMHVTPLEQLMHDLCKATCIHA